MASNAPQTYYEKNSIKTNEALAHTIRKRLYEQGSRQVMLARYIGIDPSTLNRSLKIQKETYDLRSLQPYEIVRIAKFLDCSCDELLTGIGTDTAEAQKETGLSLSAVRWLNTIRYQEEEASAPEGMQEELSEIVNLVLGDDTIAESLFAAIYFYCTAHISSRMKIDGKTEENYALLIANPETLLDLAITEFIKNILDKIRREYGRIYESTYSRRLDDKMLELISNVRIRFEQAVAEEAQNEQEENDAEMRAMHEHNTRVQNSQ
jgi:hypothetical protein